MLSHLLITIIATDAIRALGSERAAENQQPPHLLVILVDDLGYNNVGFHNDQQISPEIDRLAQEEGVVLEALYTFRYFLARNVMGWYWRPEFG